MYRLKLLTVLTLFFWSFISMADGSADAEPKRLEVIVFPGGFNWPIWAAMEQGYFDEENIEISLTHTKGSAYQMKGLIEGRYDIAMTAMDNVIAYQEGQGAATPEKTADLSAVMGSDNGFLSLVTTSDVNAVKELAGKKLAVDAMTTGYAFVLFGILDQHGLWPDGVEIESFGGVSNRFKTLLEGKHQGTMMITPFDIMSQQKGFNQLAKANDVFGDYQGVVAAVQNPWAKANEASLVSYIRGFKRGVSWLYEPQNREQAIKILLKYVPQMNEALASKSYDIMLHPETGFHRDASINMDGVETVLQLRRKFGKKEVELESTDVYIDRTQSSDVYIDTTYYDKATSGK